MTLLRQAASSILAAGIGFVAQAPIARAAAPGLSISIDATQVAISGATAKQKVAFFGVAQQVSGFGITTSRQIEVLEDADGDGVVTLKPAGGVPVRSVWFAIDLAQGIWVSGHRDEFVTAELVATRGPSAGGLPRLPLVVGEVIVARPGFGVWSAHVVDGYSGDTDGRPDGQINLAVDSLEPIGSSPPRPAKLEPNDAILAVDPITLEFVATKVQ